MNAQITRSGARTHATRQPLLLAVASVVGFLFAALAAAQSASPASASAAPGAAAMEFADPQAASDALIKAAAAFDVPALRKILGPGSDKLLSSADAVRDRNEAKRFTELARKKQSIAIDKDNPNRATLLVGTDGWPSPIPIVRSGSGWHFDTEAALREVLYRRVGENELDAIQVCRGYVEAQHEFAHEKHDNIYQYAQRIVSTPGKQDGLAWQNPDGSWGGPVGPAVAKVLEEGYTDKTQPFRGYYFKILKKQGPAAPLGQMDFVLHGAMIGGFALAAAPAEYRVTGVKTFIVGYEGIVYERDLGPDTLKTFKQMTRFNPDKNWTRTDDNW
jgi:Protein of unknown function (DUF2950)